MATNTTHDFPTRQFPLFGLPRLVPGLLLTGAITALAVWVGDIPWVAGLGLGALTLAILLGIFSRQYAVSLAAAELPRRCSARQTAFIASGHYPLRFSPDVSANC